MRLLTVLGARPQFVKAWPVSRALVVGGIDEVVVHTGQHYDPGISDAFFSELALPEPRHHLGVGSGTHGAQTARMLQSLEPVMVEESPDAVLVYGDTNSTLAGALVASKLGLPLAHVEAGLRSFDRGMPEEVNRILTDHASSLLLAPTPAAMDNLRREGLADRAHRTGDVMLDAIRLFHEEGASRLDEVAQRYGVGNGPFAVATVHRAGNTDDPVRWKGIVEGVARVGRTFGTVVWPVHPRVRERIPERLDGVRFVQPLSYFQMQALLAGAGLVLTDSGGVQKEAAFHGCPAVVLRDETEWIELVRLGVNVLSGTNADQIVEAAGRARWPEGVSVDSDFGDGHAAEAVVGALRDLFERH